MASDKIQVIEEAGIIYDLINDNLTPEYQRYKYGTMCSNVVRNYEALNTAGKIISACDGVKFPKLLQALKAEKQKILSDIDESEKLRDAYLEAHPVIETVITEELIKRYMAEIYKMDDDSPRESYLNRNHEYLQRF